MPEGPSHTLQGPAGLNRCNKDIYHAVGVLPNFRPGCFLVDLYNCCFVPIVAQDCVRSFFHNFLGFIQGTFQALKYDIRKHAKLVVYNAHAMCFLRTIVHARASHSKLDMKMQST